MGETVDGILRDIRSRAEVAGRQDEDATVHHSAVAAMLRDIADRIEAAYNNLPGMWIVPAENAKLREENERLKAALKPVLECSIEKFLPGHETYAVEPFFTSATVGVEDAEGAAISDESIAAALNAVREAQTIYNGGEE